MSPAVNPATTPITKATKTGKEASAFMLCTSMVALSVTAEFGALLM